MLISSERDAGNLAAHSLSKERSRRDNSRLCDHRWLDSTGRSGSGGRNVRLLFKLSFAVALKITAVGGLHVGLDTCAVRLSDLILQSSAVVRLLYSCLDGGCVVRFLDGGLNSRGVVRLLNSGLNSGRVVRLGLLDGGLDCGGLVRLSDLILQGRGRVVRLLNSSLDSGRVVWLRNLIPQGSAALIRRLNVGLDSGAGRVNDIALDRCVVRLDLVVLLDGSRVCGNLVTSSGRLDLTQSG